MQYVILKDLSVSQMEYFTTTKRHICENLNDIKKINNARPWKSLWNTIKHPCFGWGNLNGDLLLLVSDADCELNSLNWNECCEQTTILHTVHKKWGNFVHEGLGGENN